MLKSEFNVINKSRENVSKMLPLKESHHFYQLNNQMGDCLRFCWSPCSVRGAVGPVPDLVPLLHLPGRVPAKGDRFSGAAPAGPVRRLRPGVLLGLQGQLAPWAGLPGEHPAHHLLPPGREQVLLLTPSCLLYHFYLC